MVVQIARTVMEPGTKFHIALRRVFGLGRSNSLAVAEACGISSELKVKDVTPERMAKAEAYIQDHFIVGDALKRVLRANILRLVNIQCRRGKRHELGLPISAHTHSNGNTAHARRYLDLYDTSK